MSDRWDWYAEPGPLTRLPLHGERLDALPREIAGLCRVVQGILIHPAWAPAYGLGEAAIRTPETQIRTASAILECVLALDDADLTRARDPERRAFGTCRNFATLTTALLRRQGVRARARCGFGAYFAPGKFEDHWLVEWWDGARGAWRLTDSQIDDVQRKALGLAFDPLDVPRDQFQVAPEVWVACRSGRVDPEIAGIFDLRGLWFVQGNVVRDLASLNKFELLPWDNWGLAEQPVTGDGVKATLSTLDRIAALTVSPDAPLDQVRALFEGDPLLRVPQRVKSFAAAVPVEEAWDDSAALTSGSG